MLHGLLMKMIADYSKPAGEVLDAVSGHTNVGRRIQFWALSTRIPRSIVEWFYRLHSVRQQDKVCCYCLQSVQRRVQRITAGYVKLRIISFDSNDEKKYVNSGEVSIVIDGTWYYPQDPNNPRHRKTSEFARMSTVNIRTCQQIISPCGMVLVEWF